MNRRSCHDKNFPNHVAIVMDGNGRWAEKRGLNRQSGHEQGAKVAQDIILYALNLGINYITLYAFSTENWRRPKHEINSIMSILDYYLEKNVDDLIKNNIKVIVIGDSNRLSLSRQKLIKQVVNKTSNCSKLTVVLAISYGALEEVTNACRQIALQASSINIIDEQLLRKFLYTSDIPDPDLLIRTGGEIRLSNFLLLQLSYSELYFCPTLWPDFSRKDFDLALSSFIKRERRFGYISNS